ncbi:hypothetical protein [Azospirillum endophyticum]
MARERFCRSIGKVTGRTAYIGPGFPQSDGFLVQPAMVTISSCAP